MALANALLVAAVLCLSAVPVPADENASEVVLPPPFMPPPSALQAAERTSDASGGFTTTTLLGSSGSGSSGASAVQNDKDGFRLLKELRAAGFTCPGGQSFAPNSAELEFDCRLWQASLDHSRDMGLQNYFSHMSLDGRDPFDRSAPYGLPTFNENLAAGGATATAALEQWKESDGHCRNMMDPRHNRMGIAYFYAPSSTYKHYWTELFATDSAAPHQSCFTSTADPTTAPEDNSGADNSGTDGTCTDSDASCSGWKDQGYCTPGHMYEQFMRGSCKLSCGFCDVTDTGSDVGAGNSQGDCKEVDPTCAVWSGLGYCAEGHDYESYMKASCKVSCGICSTEASLSAWSFSPLSGASVLLAVSACLLSTRRA